LRKYERERVGREVYAKVVERRRRRSVATHPHVEILDLHPCCDRGVVDPDLVIELERPRLHCESARSGPRLGGLVDDSYFDAKSRQPEREHEPGWTGPGDQDRSVNAQTDYLSCNCRLRQATTRRRACFGKASPVRRLLPASRPFA